MIEEILEEDESDVKDINKLMYVAATNTRRVRKVKIHHLQADREIFYAYYGNTAGELVPLPANRASLTVVEQALLERDVFEMAAPIQSAAKCEVRSVIRFLNAN